MATYFSDHFSGVNPDTGVLDNAYLDKTKLPPAGIGHGRIRYARAEFTQLLVHSPEDSVRMIQFRSSDRIFEIYSTNSGTIAEGSYCIGFHKSGTKHDGASIEKDIIASNPAIHDAWAHRGEWGRAGFPDVDFYRGKPLWEVMSMPASASAGAYTKDPGEDWDLVFACCNETMDSSAQIILEVLYTTED